METVINNKHIFSMILYGPPGTGKTTIIKLPNDKAFKISPVKKQDNLKKETEEENLI